MRTHNDIRGRSALMREIGQDEISATTLQPLLPLEHWQRDFILTDDLYAGISRLTASFQSFSPAKCSSKTLENMKAYEDIITPPTAEVVFMLVL